MIIGLTGKNASGKTEVANYLVSKGYSYCSLSDVVRDEALKRGLPAERDVLIAIGNELRREHGAGILAEEIAKKVSGNTVVDSIRNPGEVEVLRKNKDFLLVGVDAPVELRFKRALERGRAGDARTIEDFRKQEDKENLNNSLNQQLDNTLKMADVVLINDQSIDELHRQIEDMLDDKA